jgi:hypothetical protein
MSVNDQSFIPCASRFALRALEAGLVASIVVESAVQSLDEARERRQDGFMVARNNSKHVRGSAGIGARQLGAT